MLLAHKLLSVNAVEGDGFILDDPSPDTRRDRAALICLDRIE
jgi:hypothetical protein